MAQVIPAERLYEEGKLPAFPLGLSLPDNVAQALGIEIQTPGNTDRSFHFNSGVKLIRRWFIGASLVGATALGLSSFAFPNYFERLKVNWMGIAPYQSNQVLRINRDGLEAFNLYGDSLGAVPEGYPVVRIELYGFHDSNGEPVPSILFARDSNGDGQQDAGTQRFQIPILEDENSLLRRECTPPDMK